MGKRKSNKYLQGFRNNYEFIDNLLLNDLTFQDYLDRFRKVALSIFEWCNLPKGMDSRFLESCLYYDGKASLLKDRNYGFINTRCCSNGYVNIYNLPSSLHCYSFTYSEERKLYTGLPSSKDTTEYDECILVMNNWEMIPTSATMELFAYRLYEAEATAFTNIKAQKTPVTCLADEKNRLTIENAISKYNGNMPFIIFDKNQMLLNTFKVLKTDAPYIADKIMDYKKEIWNETLTFLGINNIMIDKKERLVADEANSNNELINLNLQSMLAPRQEACRQFNEKYGLKGDKAVYVRLRSDLHNVIKNIESIITDYNDNGIDDKIEKKSEVVNNG